MYIGCTEMSMKCDMTNIEKHNKYLCMFYCTCSTYNSNLLNFSKESIPGNVDAVMRK